MAVKTVIRPIELERNGVGRGWKIKELTMVARGRYNLPGVQRGITLKTSEYPIQFFSVSLQNEIIAVGIRNVDTSFCGSRTFVLFRIYYRRVIFKQCVSTV